MNTDLLMEVAQSLTRGAKGVLAIDESTETCSKRFADLKVPCTEEMRREYRELIITIPGLEEYVSGLILVEETMGQSTREGKSFLKVLAEKRMLAGIKVDLGTEAFGEFPGEKVTKGLDGLGERLSRYKNAGAVFAKWRSVYTIGEQTPSGALVEENAKRFAEYAYACQEAGLVPFVEPEILMEGVHDIDTCARVTGDNLDVVFRALQDRGVYLPGMILKTSMVTSGGSAPIIASISEVAKKTLETLIAHVPTDVGGVVFLSGGQYEEIATLHLEVMKEMMKEFPWPLTFSYGRAIQKPGLELWAQDRVKNWRGAQQAILDRARANSLASAGKYQG